MTSPLPLYSTVLHLIAQDDASLPMTQGQYVHAAFLGLVHDVDPDLAEILHSSNGRKPFTVSPLMGARNGQPAELRATNGQIRLRAGDECLLRFTLIGRDLFATFTRRLLFGNLHPRVRLGEAGFDIAAAWTTPGSHEWAGAATAQDLVGLRMAHDIEVPRIVTLQFVTPTSFNVPVCGKQREWLALLPEWVFGDLAHKWLEMECTDALDLATLIEELAPGDYDLSPLQRRRKLFFEQVLLKEQINVNTRALHLQGKPQIGSTGTLSYEVFGDDDLARVVNVLADAAFFFGVGRKTTMGMGQCRRF